MRQVRGCSGDSDDEPRLVQLVCENYARAVRHEAISIETQMAATPYELRALLLQECDAIAYAHSRGVLHRDLKPANVMLGHFGETLVVDWGLAKPFIESDIGRVASISDQPNLVPASGSGVDLTADGSAIGTPAYMSPEQAEGRFDKSNFATDIYGLGAILYSLLCNQPPVQGSSAAEILSNVRKGEIWAPRSINSQVALSMEAICLKALSRDAADRYPTARLLADDIESFLADEAITARRDPFVTRTWRWIRSLNDRVQCFTANGTFLFRLNGIDDNDTFTHPHGIAQDSQGFLYIADSGNQRIVKFQLPSE